MTVQTSDPSYTAQGSTVYTAAAAFEGKTYTDKKTVAIPALDARDLNVDGKVNTEDGIYLFMNRLFGSGAYPLPAGDEKLYDFNKDGKTDLDDAASLLFEAGPAGIKDGRVTVAAYGSNGRMTGLMLLKSGGSVSGADTGALKAAAKIRFIFMDKGYMPAAAAQVRDVPAAG